MSFFKSLGHEKQKNLFVRLFGKGELGHAYAFVGPENVGKTIFALELAEVLGADRLLDVFLFDAPEGLTIQEARLLQNRLNLTSTRGMKVAVVAGAERMSLAAANSLLKILEEPPAHSLLILTTANFYQLPPTIASRVQKIIFAKSQESEVRKALAPFSLGPQKKEKIVELSHGRIGLAIRLATDDLLFEFWQGFTKKYHILQHGSLVERLQTSALLAELEASKLLEFLRFAMQEWIKNPVSNRLGEELQMAWDDFNFNLNPKLVLDNLFLASL